jgi:lipopolysaccharide transport system ATP-binding protein
MGQVVLEARGLYKKFKKGEIHGSLRDLVPALLRRAVTSGLGREEFWALRDVNFQVERGEAFGIIGHNGAGKSTLLKHLCGILVPTSGTLSVKGRLSALIEVGAGFHPDLTGRENIYLNGTILGMNRAEIRSKFDAIVAFSELEEFLDTPVKRYSSGMYARLGFAVAAHVEPDVLVVDEVLSVGDFLFQRKSVEKMRQVMRSGTTVVFVSHNLRAVAELCPRSMLLDHGTVVAVGPSGEVIKRYMERGAEGASRDEAKDAYLGRITLGQGDGRPGVQFRSGERMVAEIEVVARRPTEKLAVVIQCLDDEMYDVFNTSTQRLGCASFSLGAGERFVVRFALTLRLAPGSYHLGVYLYRYDIQKDYDTRIPAQTFFVSSDVDIRGVADLEPVVLHHEKASG